jgi:chemotaxis protein methyltransferase CheR
MNDSTDTHEFDKSALISTSSEKKFIDFIRERLGIIIHPHQKNDLQKLIIVACKKFNYSTDAYITKLTESRDNSPLIEHLILGITIGETYFFRDANQIRLLQNSILPELINRKRQENNRSIRIWSAGSSSGEEIYTIAMLLCDMLPDINAWTLNLLGTDINTSALKKAMTGQYREWSMRSIPERYKQRYFTVKDQQYILTQKLRDMVNFAYLNLNNDTFPSILNDTNAKDLIICRNVLIYFDHERGATLMKKLSHCLAPGGHLILGASDPIYSTDSDLTFNQQQGAVFTRSLVSTVAETKANTIETAGSAVKKPDKVLIKSPSHSSNDDIGIAKKPLSPDTLNNQISNLLNDGAWQEALNIIHLQQQDTVKSAFFLSAEATAFANLGKLDQAAQCCYQSLALDATNIETHFTLAMVLVELNRLKDAENELRKTLFLDHQFVMGHFQLGLLLIKNQQFELGIKCLKNALSIVKAKNPDDVVAGFQKIIYGNLAEILEHEIELHMPPKDPRHDSHK